MLSEPIARASVGTLPPPLPHRTPDLPATRVVPDQPEAEVTQRLRSLERERDLLRAHVAIVEQQKHSLETRLAEIDNDYLVQMVRKLRHWWRARRIRV